MLAKQRNDRPQQTYWHYPPRLAIKSKKNEESLGLRGTQEKERGTEVSTEYGALCNEH